MLFCRRLVSTYEGSSEAVDGYNKKRITQTITIRNEKTDDVKQNKNEKKKEDRKKQEKKNVKKAEKKTGKI